MTSPVDSLPSRRARFRSLPPVLRALFWMIFGTFSFALMIVLVRKASHGFSAIEITFWRALFGLVFMTPWLFRTRLIGLRPTRPRLHLLRNVVHLAGIIMWYYAVSRINLTEGIALQFTVPLFTITLAVLFLRERVDGQRWAATIVGFSGVLIILRPGLVEISSVALVVLLSAALYAGSNTCTKVIGRTDSSDLVVFYMNLMHLPMALVLALITGWSIPGWADLPWLAGVAASATVAHYCLAQAFREADASVVMPIDFLKLPWITVMAFLAFDERPETWAWAGGAVIFGATYYIVRREAKSSRAGA